MGFYPPASLVRDAQRRGVEVRPPDVNLSDARCTWDEGAVRLGLSYVRSVGEDDAQALVAEREANGPYANVGDLARRTSLDARELEALLRSGACDRWGKRRDLLWELGLVTRPQTVQREHKQLTLALDPTAATPELRDLNPWERMLADYASTSVSVDVHPLTLLRPHLPADVLPSDVLNEAPHRSRVAFAGMAVARQRPATAKGIVFMLLEDELGQVNLIVSPEVYERNRPIVRGEPLLLVRGRFERIKDNRNIVVETLESLGPLARRLSQADVGEALPAAHHFGHR
jgi:error-prone DNA polymerase